MQTLWYKMIGKEVKTAKWSGKVVFVLRDWMTKKIKVELENGEVFSYLEPEDVFFEKRIGKCLLVFLYEEREESFEWDEIEKGEG